MRTGRILRRQRSLSAWKKSLERRHALLEDEIEAERRRPAPDPLWVQTLKRHKLRVKEQMSEIDGVLRLVGPGPA